MPMLIEFMARFFFIGVGSDTMPTSSFQGNHRVDLCGNQEMAPSGIFMKSLFERAANQIDSLWVWKLLFG